MLAGSRDLLNSAVVSDDVCSYSSQLDSAIAHFFWLLSTKISQAAHGGLETIDRFFDAYQNSDSLFPRSSAGSLWTPCFIGFLRMWKHGVRHANATTPSDRRLRALWPPRKVLAASAALPEGISALLHVRRPDLEKTGLRHGSDVRSDGLPQGGWRTNGPSRHANG